MARRRESELRPPSTKINLDDKFIVFVLDHLRSVPASRHAPKVRTAQLAGDV